MMRMNEARLLKYTHTINCGLGLDALFGTSKGTVARLRDDREVVRRKLLILD
jgi:hypothetical protein